MCARWTGCESTAARASGKVCLGGERRGPAGRRQLSRGELVGSSALRVPGRSASSETRSPPSSPGQLGGTGGRGIADGSRDAWGPGLVGPSRTLHPAEVLWSWASVSRPLCGDGRPERSHNPSARTRCAGNLAAGCSLTLAAALYSGKCLRLPERPPRSQVAVGRRVGSGKGLRPGARALAARLGSVPKPEQ